MPPLLRLAYWRLRALVPIAVIAGLLGLLPFTTCLVKIVTGYPCPGCGMTRATLCLLHGDVTGSLRFHPIALPGALGLTIAVVLALALPEGHPSWERFVRASMSLLAASLLIAWVLRFVRVLPMV